MSEINEDFATGSVISFLEREGYERVEDYLSLDNKNRVGFPNYSDMISVLDLIGGTTREGIKFDSTKVERGRVTLYLRERFNEKEDIKQ